MRESFSGGVNNPIYSTFPVRLIKRVEVIRGPGSVLYGTNAFSGAINIVTKTSDDFDGLQISQGIGSFQTYDSEGMFARHIDDFSIIGAARTMNAKGWNFSAIDGAGTFGSINYGQEVQSGYFQAAYDTITVTGYSGALDENTLGFATLFPSDPAYGRRRFLDFEYKTDPFPNGWQGTFNTTYNGYDGVITASNSPVVSTRSSDDILFEASMRGPITDATDILFGASFENHQVVLKEDDFYNSLLSTGYGQVDYKPYDWLRLTAGGQVNQAKGTRRDFAPRLAGIVNFDDYWGVKLLHAKAYRAPQAIERKDLTTTLLGNTGLKSETIRTTDLQLFYSDPQLKGSLTYYQSHQKDTIVRTPAGAAFQFNNGGTVDYEGVEIEGTYAPYGSPLSYTGSISWQSGRDENGNADVGIVPHYMAKLGVTYAPDDMGYSIGVFDSFYSTPAKISDAFPSVSNVNPPSKPTHLMTMNASMHIPTYFNDKNLPDVTINLFADNLLDDDFDFPQYTSPRVNTLPSRSGRAFYARATVKF